MPKYICVTCGTQLAEGAFPPDHCPICEDERQYIGANGQQWTTLAELQQSRTNLIKPIEANLTGIGSDPRFAIGQRALLVQTPAGKALCSASQHGEVVHLVSLVRHESGAALAQERVASKIDERDVYCANCGNNDNEFCVRLVPGNRQGQQG